MTARKATKKTAKRGKSQKKKARKVASAARPKKKAASKKAARKPAAKATKKATKKAAKPARKPAAKPKGKAKEPAKKTSGRKAPAVSSARSKARARRAKKASKGPVIPGQPPPGPRQTRLGQKWACFSCGAKFYDLNAPEPLCPKCGADQHSQPPKKATPAPAAPARKKESRPLAPYLDDDDDATRRDSSLRGDELDVGIAGMAADDDVDPGLDLEGEAEETVEDED